MLIEICNLGDHCFLTVNSLPHHSFVPEYCTRFCCRVFIGTERYHTDNDNSSVEDSDSNDDKELLGLQERKGRDKSSNDDSDSDHGLTNTVFVSETVASNL